MPLFIVRQDITKMTVDAIVNAANTELKMGGGVCGAIFKAAGAEKLQAACNKVAPIQTGGAAITPGFALQAKYVIHAAGPVYSYWHKEQCRTLLYSAYTQSLKLAEKNGCESIAFPLISSGIYGYPKGKAFEVARLAIEEYLSEHEMEVYLVVFDKAAFMVSKALLGSVKSYIDEHYVETHQADRRRFLRVEKDAVFGKENSNLGIPPMMSAPMSPSMSVPMSAPMPVHSKGIDDLIKNLDEPFSDTLLKLIDTKGKTDVEVYKKANIDRKLFSKIRTGKGYTPKKPTILALAIGLELTLAETDTLLERAGYALSHASKFDVIIEYLIINGKYNIF